MTHTSASDGVGVLAEAPNGAKGLQATASGNNAVEATATGAKAIRAESDGSGEYGISAKNAASTGTCWGVRGETQSKNNQAYGVRGNATSDSGAGKGVAGDTYSEVAGAAGVYGRATQSASTETYGVYGTTGSAAGYGVYSAEDSKTDGTHEITGNADVGGHVSAAEGFRGNVGASAFLSANQSIPSDLNFHRVGFDSTVADERNEFDTSTVIFSPAYDGTYHVSIGIRWEDFFSGEVVRYTLNLDGLSSDGMFTKVIQDTNTSKTFSKTLVGLTAGTDITVDVRQESGSSTDIWGDGNTKHTYFTIHQVG